MTSFKRKALITFVCITVIVVACALLIRPSNHRDWTLDQQVLVHVVMEGDRVRIQNVRNFNYRSTTDFIPAYVDKDLDLQQLRRAWFMVERLSDKWIGLAHTLVSFEFEDGQTLAVSVEIRKEKGESFSPLKGLFRRFELMYVVAEESDVIRLRTNYRHHDVYFYPIQTTPDKVRELFVHMMTRAQRLETQPEFYNTITNTCTTNIVQHVRRIAPGRIPRSYKVLLPGYSDRLAYDIGLIDTAAPFEAIQRRYWVSGKAREAQNGQSFSDVIRFRAR